MLAATTLFVGACGQPLQARSPTSSPISGSTPSSPTSSAQTATSPPSTVASSARQDTAPCPDTQPAPQFGASAPSNRNLELVWIKGSSKSVVRDITDALHPTNVSTLPNLNTPQFVNGSELSYSTGSALIRLPLSGSPQTTVASACNNLFAFAWSPDGRTAAYVTNTQDSSVGQFHLVVDGKDRVAGKFPRIPVTGCVAPCSDFVDIRLLYSPNGAYISLVSLWGGPFVRVWASDGRLLTKIDADARDGQAGPTMSVWSGNTLFYRDKLGIEAWHEGAQSLVVPGVAWMRPKASPTGGQITYAAKDGSGTPNVFLLDTVASSTRLIAKSRSEPFFLNSHLIWYKEERPCRSGDAYPCGVVSTAETGKTYIYDLADHTETESGIAVVFDAWPHPA